MQDESGDIYTSIQQLRDKSDELRNEIEQLESRNEIEQHKEDDERLDQKKQELHVTEAHILEKAEERMRNR